MCAKNKCPVENCTEMIHSNLSLCIPHWRLVPMTLKQEIISTRESGSDKYAERLEQAIAVIQKRELK